VEHVQHVYLPTCTSLLNLTIGGDNSPQPIHRGMASHTCTTNDYNTTEKIYQN
ncbi:hypothetical protein M9458_037390, partial [Cirrhinus mrigala]